MGAAGDAAAPFDFPGDPGETALRFLETDPAHRAAYATLNLTILAAGGHPATFAAAVANDVVEALALTARRAHPTPARVTAAEVRAPAARAVADLVRRALPVHDVVAAVMGAERDPAAAPR